MLVESIAFFLAVSILLYCLFAGADFGAGILEAFLGAHRRQEQRAVITHAMGPVWEANHVWLILAVVILFTGFPKAYSALSITFHIPLTVMLIGIVLGPAFHAVIPGLDLLAAGLVGGFAAYGFHRLRQGRAE